MRFACRHVDPTLANGVGNSLECQSRENLEEVLDPSSPCGHSATVETDIRAGSRKACRLLLRNLRPRSPTGLASPLVVLAHGAWFASFREWVGGWVALGFFCAIDRASQRQWLSTIEAGDGGSRVSWSCLFDGKLRGWPFPLASKALGCVDLLQT